MPSVERPFSQERSANQRRGCHIGLRGKEAPAISSTGSAASGFRVSTSPLTLRFGSPFKTNDLCTSRRSSRCAQIGSPRSQWGARSWTYMTTPWAPSGCSSTSPASMPLPPKTSPAPIGASRSSSTPPSSPTTATTRLRLHFFLFPNFPYFFSNFPNSPLSILSSYSQKSAIGIISRRV